MSYDNDKPLEYLQPIWMNEPDSFYEWVGQIYDNTKLQDIYDTAPKNIIILVNEMCFLEIVENKHEQLLKINVDLVKDANQDIYHMDEKMLRDAMNAYLKDHKQPRFHYYEVFDVVKAENNKIEILLQFEIEKSEIGGFTWDIYMDDIEYLGIEFIYINNFSAHIEDAEDTLVGISDNMILNILAGELVRNSDIPVTSIPGTFLRIDNEVMRIQQFRSYNSPQDKPVDMIKKYLEKQIDRTMKEIEKYVSDEPYREHMLFKLEEFNVDVYRNTVDYVLTLYIPMKKLRIITWGDAISQFDKFYKDVIYNTFEVEDNSIVIEYDDAKKLFEKPNEENDE